MLIFGYFLIFYYCSLLYTNMLRIFNPLNLLFTDKHGFFTDSHGLPDELIRAHPFFYPLNPC